jgi:hypothetical protein
MASDNPVALCHPLPYGRRAAPSKEDGGALKGKTDNYSTPAQDYAVTLGRRDRSPPSPSVLCGHPRRPQHHPGHCITIPYTVGGRGDKTSPCRLLCSLRPPVTRILKPMYGRRLNEKPLYRHPRSRSWMDTRHAMTPRQMQDSPGWPSTPQRCTPCLYT